jgi:hypothetical protein
MVVAPPVRQKYLNYLTESQRRRKISLVPILLQKSLSTLPHTRRAAPNRILVLVTAAL